MCFSAEIISLYILFEFDGAIASNFQFYESGNLDVKMQQATIKKLPYLFKFVSVDSTCMIPSCIDTSFQMFVTNSWWQNQQDGDFFPHVGDFSSVKNRPQTSVADIAITVRNSKQVKLYLGRHDSCWTFIDNFLEFH